MTNSVVIPKSVPKKLRERIQFWDDERGLGNSLIVTLEHGWHWAGIDPYPGMHVAGFDTVSEVITELRATASCNCRECVEELKKRNDAKST